MKPELLNIINIQLDLQRPHFAWNCKTENINKY